MYFQDVLGSVLKGLHTLKTIGFSLTQRCALSCMDLSERDAFLDARRPHSALTGVRPAITGTQRLIA